MCVELAVMALPYRGVREKSGEMRSHLGWAVASAKAEKKKSGEGGGRGKARAFFWHTLE
jgi:hypothetical protein